MKQELYSLANVMDCINELEKEQKLLPIFISWNGTERPLSNFWYIEDGCAYFILDVEEPTSFIYLTGVSFIGLLEKEATDDSWNTDIYKSPMSALTECEMYFINKLEDLNKITLNGYANEIDILNDKILLKVVNMEG